MLSTGTKVPLKKGGLPKPSAEADGKGRTYSTEIQVNIHEALTVSCNILAISTIIVVGHNLSVAFRGSLFFSFAFAFSWNIGFRVGFVFSLAVGFSGKVGFRVVLLFSFAVGFSRR